MTKKQIATYQAAYIRDNYTCQICGKQATQMAHRIANTKYNRSIYTDYVIDHIDNIIAVCGLECNSKCNIGNKDEIARKLASGILGGGALKNKSNFN